MDVDERWEHLLPTFQMFEVKKAFSQTPFREKKREENP